MHSHLLFAALASIARASPTQGARGCREVQIPVTVSVPRFHITTSVHDNWDATALSFNLTRRDFGSAEFPLPISGATPGPVESNYTVGATVCGHGGPTLVLTHGIIESKLYWQPNLPDAGEYTFIDAAVAAGYTVLSYDRIGVGSSSKVNSLIDAQFQVETAVLDSLINYAQTKLGSTKVALVGHSYGAYISAASAAQSPVDALVLTGFSGTFDFFGPFVAGAGFRVARIQDPGRWGELDAGWLISADLYAETYAYFAEPFFEHRVAEWSYGVASEPFAVGELPSLLNTTIVYGDITAPVLLLQGQYDVSACGGNCAGVLEEVMTKLKGARVVERVDDLPAG
ncbi:hypothetical protein JX266_004123 [Neoarthrinium moseri]|nr:hypothetical protein JX266_004123 [Neoarthrinium moseri]